MTKTKDEKPDAFTIAAQFLTERYVVGKKSKGEKAKTLQWWKDDFYPWDDGCYEHGWY